MKYNACVSVFQSVSSGRRQGCRKGNNVWLFLGTWSIAQSRHLHVSASGSSAGSASSGRSEAAECERSERAERRKSGDDILNQTVQSPRKATPTIFDAFRPRSKSDASRTKKPSTLIAQMKNAVQVSTA